MTRKANKVKPSTLDETQPDVETNDLPNESSTAETGVDESASVELESPFAIVLSGKGKKLSPKTLNHVFYEIAINGEDDLLYLRLSGNEGGGLHSTEWLNLESVMTLIEQQGTRPFKSTVFKSVFAGSSANNAGFLAAVVRAEDIGLINQSAKSVFLHVVSSDYDERKAALLALASTKAP